MTSDQEALLLLELARRRYAAQRLEKKTVVNLSKSLSEYLLDAVDNHVQVARQSVKTVYKIILPQP